MAFCSGIPSNFGRAYVWISAEIVDIYSNALLKERWIFDSDLSGKIPVLFEEEKE